LGGQPASRSPYSGRRRRVKAGKRRARPAYTQPVGSSWAQLRGALQARAGGGWLWTPPAAPAGLSDPRAPRRRPGRSVRRRATPASTTVTTSGDAARGAGQSGDTRSSGSRIRAEGCGVAWETGATGGTRTAFPRLLGTLASPPCVRSSWPPYRIAARAQSAEIAPAGDYACEPLRNNAGRGKSPQFSAPISSCRARPIHRPTSALRRACEVAGSRPPLARSTVATSPRREASEPPRR
jgi:hypothetical protein